jgi:hypothetical protein
MADPHGTDSREPCNYLRNSSLVKELRRTSPFAPFAGSPFPFAVRPFRSRVRAVRVAIRSF